mmetsp:Transcript_25695/g.54904  ORF Transcript_25695/g.54904 Transcript_25695/m.54904 type:complete len:251 (-) Transcript_25695:196-948(-)
MDVPQAWTRGRSVVTGFEGSFPIPFSLTAGHVLIAVQGLLDVSLSTLETNEIFEWIPETVGALFILLVDDSYSSPVCPMQLKQSVFLEIHDKSLFTVDMVLVSQSTSLERKSVVVFCCYSRRCCYRALSICVFACSCFYSIQVISPISKVLDGSPPAQGLSRCSRSVSVTTLSTAQKPATPAVTRSRPFPDWAKRATADGWQTATSECWRDFATSGSFWMSTSTIWMASVDCDMALTGSSELLRAMLLSL